MNEVQNAGLRLWEVQKRQRTGLCVGLDPHTKPLGDVEPGFYRRFSESAVGLTIFSIFYDMLGVMQRGRLVRPVNDPSAAAGFAAGLVAYFLEVVEAGWAAGIRTFKPQAAFWEVLAPFGGLALEMICYRLEQLARATGEQGVLIFMVLDAKRGDIDSTQAPYFHAYLTSSQAETYPGMQGRYQFNTMTVTTWMGLDVLTPGLPHFRQGMGGIVVTRTSNPSGTTLQDALVSPNPDLELSPKQEPFRYTPAMESEIVDIMGRKPTASELMLYQTEKFSRDNGLNQDGVSPLFSVMGSTVKMTDSFRKLRPGGIALVPGFGEQKGAFANILPLYISEGPMAGHLGILASSRAHNFPWMKKYGGNDDPANLRNEMARAVDQFRQDERDAYAAAGLYYPFAV